MRILLYFIGQLVTISIAKNIEIDHPYITKNLEISTMRVNIHIILIIIIKYMIMIKQFFTEI